MAPNDLIIHSTNGKNSTISMNSLNHRSVTTKTNGFYNNNENNADMSIHRKVYNVTDFNDDYDPVLADKSFCERMALCAPDCSRKTWIRRVTTLFPILVWLPQYNIRQSLLMDIMVGITVGIFQVPQGMGYALIAHLPPVNGLYSTFFPPLSYLFLGGGQHVSVGTYAIVSGLMTGDMVITVMNEIRPGGANTTLPGFNDIQNIDIALITGFVIGIYMLGFGILQLGFISNFLSTEMISGFISAAGIITLTSQVPGLLGITIKNYTGLLAFPLTWINIFSILGTTNIAALIISIISLAALIFVKYFLDVRIAKLGIKFPLPIDLVVLIIATVISYCVDLNHIYHVKIVGNIPRGFPPPVVPKFELFPFVWGKCISIAVVAYVTTLSVGKIYGAKHGYKVDVNQELIALGATNVWSSFFRCLPAAASLPRSALMDQAGGKSQIAFAVNCVCMLAVILALGALLEKLPVSALSACVAIAVVSLCAKVFEFKRFWSVSKIDGSIWMITFLCTLILNVDYGIYIGFGCSLLLLIYKSQRPKTYMLGSVDESDIYVPVKKYGRAKEIKGVKIYQFCGPLNFANVQFFMTEMQTKCGVDIDSIKGKLKKEIERQQESDNPGCCLKFRSRKDVFTVPKPAPIKSQSLYHNLPSHIIIDCSMFAYIDTSGVNALKNIVKRFKDIGINAVLCGCQVHIEKMLKIDGFFAELTSDHVYKTVHDAVIFCKQVQPKTDSYEMHV